MVTSFPALDLRNVVHHEYSSSGGYTSRLFSRRRELLVGHTEVIVLQGAMVSRKLVFEEPIITATYTAFASDQHAGAAVQDALVVCLSKSLHVYYEDGRQYTVSLPFTLRMAFAFEFGLMLEKEPSMQLLHVAPSQSFHQAKFLTLVDPNGDFKLVSTSSTSVVSPHEVLVLFPAGSSKNSSLKTVSHLCVTHNDHDKTLVLYQVRSSHRVTKHLRGVTTEPHPLPPDSYRPIRRKSSMVLTSSLNTHLIDEDHITANTGMNSHAHLINMEKKRTSTLLSDISSIARMGSGSDSGPFAADSFKKQHESTAGLRKDLILTKLDTFNFVGPLREGLVHTLAFEDEEAVVILDTSKSRATVYVYRQHPVHVFRFQLSYVIACTSCTPLHNESHPGYLVVSPSSTLLQLVNPFLDIRSMYIHTDKTFPKVASVGCSFQDEVVMTAFETRKNYKVTLVLAPLDELTARCLQCFQFLSGSKIRETFWILWCSALTLDDERGDWNALVIVLLSILLPFVQNTPPSVNHITRLIPKAKRLHDLIFKELQYSFVDLMPFIVMSLHFIQEDLRLDSLSTDKHIALSVLLCQLTTWMGWSEAWTSYYEVTACDIDQQTLILLVSICESPPNIFQSLSSLFGNDTIVRYFTFSQLVEEEESVDREITPRTFYVLRIFEMIVATSRFSSKDVVDFMCLNDITASDLETYPPGIYFPLKEVILGCQDHPAFEWRNQELDLVGRKDLGMFWTLKDMLLTDKSTVNDDEVGADVESVISYLCDKPENITAWDGQLEADRIAITKLIFDFDRRYFEITTLLHQTKVQTASINSKGALSEYDFVLLQRELAALVAARTLTIPLGRAALFYSSRMPLMTEKFPIPKFNFNTLIAPSMVTIIQNREAINESMYEWGYFHNGVSSGLSILADSKGISSLWIIFNKPPDLNAQHAGFLLGLGLNGHLKKLEEWHIYNYLGPKHPLTSVGLLLGMLASLRGTMDNKLTKVLSVHAVALLPQGANNLNVPIIVQTAGLIGIGLLYLESLHRRMSEVLLSQITSSVYQNDIEQIHEGYRFAAGIALGFVNLGKGNDLKGLNDTHVVDKLLNLATSMKDFQTRQELDKSSSGAIIALAFMYLRTENRVLATKLQIPDSERLLDYVRPDLLLLRCMSKNLILWDDIKCTVEWIELEVPKYLTERYSSLGENMEQELELDSDELAYFNIVGGVCFAMAIKFTSSNDLMARDTILHYLDKFMWITGQESKNYDQKSARQCAAKIRNLLAVCAALIMTASGDLDTLRRLRVLHNETQTNSMGYGGYMAINMALGFLFLGGGQYAMNNSNLAVACLITAVYPSFPYPLLSSSMSTAKYRGGSEVHLEAMRHFWALSVEPRCLVVRDVMTNRPCKVPVRIQITDGAEPIQAMSPCLLPNLDSIESIQIMSPHHFEVNIDFILNSEYLEKFKRTLTIFVYKRKNYEILKSSVAGLLENKDQDLLIANGELMISPGLVKIHNLDIFTRSLSEFERRVYLSESLNNDEDGKATLFSASCVIDNKIELEQLVPPRLAQDMWNLRLVFAFSDSRFDNMNYITHPYIDKLKQRLALYRTGIQQLT